MNNEIQSYQDKSTGMFTNVSSEFKNLCNFSFIQLYKNIRC